MNETMNAPGQGPHPGPTPQAGPPHQALDRLRRSTSDRYIAGVAGGLGRHFDIDPTVIRVLLVVLTFFGGAGLVVYVVCWLFVPEDTAEHAAIDVAAEPRKIVLIAAAAVAGLLAVGDAFHGWHAGWPLVSLAIILAIVLVRRDRPGKHTPAASGTPTDTSVPPPAYAATAPVATEDTRELDAGVDPGGRPPAWQPPVARPPLLPPRPKRTGIVWFWPTLALIAVGLGVLGIYDNDHHVVDGAYPALALAITAVMLLIGSVVGRPGGLILVGFVSSVALAGSVAVGGSFGTDAKVIHEAPTTSAQVRSDYAATVGEIKLDLTGVSDPEALAGRKIDLRLRTGNIEVIVPRSLNVDIDAKMDFAGGIKVPGDDGGGFNHTVRRLLNADPASSTAPLQLDVDAKFGQITVEYR